MDCYVEFQSVYEAQIAVNHLVYRGHALRLGHSPHDRVVNVTMSSQDELMKQLFPRAKNVVWVDGKPVIQASNEPFNTGFKTFITGEELVMMCKHAEQPHRVSACLADQYSAFRFCVIKLLVLNHMFYRIVSTFSFRNRLTLQLFIHACLIQNISNAIGS